jgi:hypothetical protein
MNSKLHTYIRKQLITQILKTMKLYITKQLDFGTQIYTQKYTKHYYLIKLKTQLEFGTQIYTQKYTKHYYLIKLKT